VAPYVEEDEGPDRSPRGGGKDAPDIEPAEATASLRDHHLNHVGSPPLEI